MNIVGIDEVGRGCWAGPLVAAAVVLKKPIDGLKDSKLLSKKQREMLDSKIRDQAISIGIGWADVDTINNRGLTVAVAVAMSMAIEQIDCDYDEVIIDGNYNYLPNNPKVRVLPKADSLIDSVSAASIVAKVYRDNLMTELSKKYPEYGFDKHVGYGTKLHIDSLKTYGICEIHRINYKPIRALLAT